MTSGQYSFCLLLNADWLIQISEGLAVCKAGPSARCVASVACERRSREITESLQGDGWVLKSHPRDLGSQAMESGSAVFL